MKIAISRQRIRWILLSLFLSSAMLCPFVIHQCAAPVYFHQFTMQKLEINRVGVLSSTTGEYLRSLYDSGVAIIFYGKSAPESLDDPRAVFDYLYSFLPKATYVLPTEQLYYFRTSIQGQLIAGNIRVADLEQGKLTMVYYPVLDPTNVRSFALSTDKDAGFQVARFSGGISTVYQGRTVQFHVSAVNTRPPAIDVLADSELPIGLVYDESGQRFWLVYNTQRTCFYYLVAMEFGISEVTTELRPGLLLGLRTSFIYYQHPKIARVVLVAVSQYNLESNNYFDGPGDQVPIHLKLRDLMYEAYPGARLQGGLNEYGVLNDSSRWARYAICPYQKYRSSSEIVHILGLVGQASTLPIDDAAAVMTREPWNNDEWREFVKIKLLLEGENEEK